MGHNSKGCSSCSSHSDCDSCSGCSDCGCDCPPKKKKTDDFTADYVLVGLGTAGAPLARYLSEDLKTSVLVIEAGENLSSDPQVLNAVEPATTPSVLTTDPKYAIVRNEYPGGAPNFNVPLGTGAIVPAGLLLAFKQIWGYSDGKMWGGSSGHNGVQAFRSSPRVFNAWATDSGSAQWNYTNILPYLRAAETFTSNGTPVNPAQRGFVGPIAITSAGQLTVHPLYAAEASATGVANQAVTNFDYHDPTSVAGVLGVTSQQRFVRQTVAPVNGVFPVGSTTRSWAFDFLRGLVDSDGNGLGGRKLKILSKAWATRIELKGSGPDLTATGVEFAYDGDKETIRVARARKKVILCGGANVNPQLLELSGIGSSAILTPLGIPVLVDSPNVGANMQNHYGPGAQINGTGAPGGMPTFMGGRHFIITDGSTAGVLPPGVVQGINQAPDGVRRCQLSASIGNVNVPQEVLNVLNLVRPNPTAANTIQFNNFNLIPNRLGSVHIVTTDPFTPPRLVSGFYQDGPYAGPGYTDLHRNVDILRQIANISITWTGQLPLYPPREFYPAAEYAVYGGTAPNTLLLEAVAKTTSLVAAYHNSGTCRMGGSIASGVVDGNLDVFGVKGLSCCDCSVTSEIQDGNTAHAMYALGLRKAAIEGAVVPV